jgi:peptidoglycan hydrolase-like protein with peptidoglycan-binding domain
MRFIRVVTMTVALGVLGLCLTATASAAGSEGIKKVQQSLSDKGYNAGPIDGILGHRTRAAIREFQKAEKLPVTGRLDAETAGRLGVGPESIGGSFETAGHEIGRGGQELGHEMKHGKPIAGGKEFGKGVGRAAQSVGSGVKKAVTTDSDRGDREKK